MYSTISSPDITLASAAEGEGPRTVRRHGVGHKKHGKRVRRVMSEHIE